MTVSKQSQDGTAIPSWLCLETVIKKTACNLPVPNAQ